MSQSGHTSTVCVGTPGSTDRPRRVPTHPLRLLLLAVGAIVVLVSAATQFDRLFRSELNAPIDFAAFWAAGHLAAEGENAYRGDRLAEVQASVGLTDLAVTAWNPPWTLTLLLPFGAVPFRAAYGLWVLTHFSLMAASALMLWRAFDAPKRYGWVPLAITFTFVPTIFLIGGGQLTAIVLFGLAGFALACRAERPVLAGAALALVAIKPHLLVPFGVWLLLSAWRTPFGRRVLLGALAAGALMCVPPTLAAPYVWPDYLAALSTGPNAGIRPLSAWQPPLVGWWLRQAVPGAPFWVQWLPTALAALATAAWCVRIRSRLTSAEVPARTPWLVGVSLLVAPYGAWSYDLVLLLPAVLAVAARLAHAPERRAASAVARLMSVNALTLVMMFSGVSSEWYVWVAPCVLLGAWAARKPTAPAPLPEGKGELSLPSPLAGESALPRFAARRVRGGTDTDQEDRSARSGSSAHPSPGGEAPPPSRKGRGRKHRHHPPLQGRGAGGDRFFASSRGEPRVSARNLLAAVVVVALVAWFWSRGEQFLANNGPTFDEPVHLAAGYSYWTTGSFRLNREDPPLLKLLWAVPLLFGERPPYPHEAAAATNDDHWHVGTAFLFNSDRTPSELLSPARRVNLALGCAVVLLAGWFAFRIWNSKLAGVGAIAFAASDPNLLALSCVLTTDIGLTLFSLLACYLLWEYAAKPSRGLLIASGIALGLALGSKFSALALVAGLGAAGFVYVLCGGILSLPSPLAGEGGGASPPGEGCAELAERAEPTSGAEVHPSPGSQSLATLSRKGRGQETPRVRLARAFPFAFRLGLIALVTLAATYGFVHFDQWGRGLKFQLTRADHGDGMMYLNGELSRRGWYHYFLVLLPLKLPVGLLLGLVVACLTGAFRRIPRAAFLLVPPLVFFALASYSRVDLGIRVILPVLPFLCVLAAGLAGSGRLVCKRREQDRSEAPECLANRALLLLCAAIAAFSSAKQDPAPLAYFNEIAGGPQRGIRYVADSNLDWGQGLPQLKAYLAANGPDVIYLSYFGTDRPEAYGIRFQALPTYGRVGEPGGELVPEASTRHVLVVSANNLLGIYLNDPDTFAWLRDRKPTEVLGGCLYVYDLTGDADAIRRVRSLPAK